MAEAQQKMLARTLDELCEAVAADGGAAFYIDDGEGALQRVASSGGGGVRSPRLLELLRDVNYDQRTLMLTVPGTRSGLLLLTRKSGGTFTQQDRAVARLWVRRLADSTHGTGAYLAPSVWTRRIAAIQHVGARLNRLGSVAEVGATICRGTFAIIGNDEAHLLLTDDQGYLQPIAHMTRAEDAPRALPYDGPIARHIERAVAESMPVLEKKVADAGSDRAGVHSLLVVPLLHEGVVNGVLCLIAAGEGRFDDDHLRLLQILSDQAAVAIENARLLSGRDALVHELAGLLEVSEAAGAASDERELSAQLATRMRRATGADAVRVSRWEEGSTALHLLAQDPTEAGEEVVELAESGLRWTALCDGRSVLAQVDTLDHGPEARELRAAGVRTLLVVPLTAGGRTIGLVELLALHQPLSLTESPLNALEAMASLTATGLERIRLLEQLRSAADTDLVTGVHSHRYLQERLRQEVARAARSHAQLAVLMMDLDKFKQVNDRHSHADGDRVLHNIGATILAEVRANDIVARYGGDEFVVIMPDTAAAQAELVADRVVRAIRNRRHALSDGAQISVGVSAGLAMYPADGRTTAQLLGAADAAMYDIKRTGSLDDQRAAGHTPMEAAAAS